AASRCRHTAYRARALRRGGQTVVLRSTRLATRVRSRRVGRRRPRHRPVAVPDALTLTVTDITVETPHTRRLHVALGDTPFAYRAGQGVALGLHGQPERRPYSIACAPEVAEATGQLEFLLRVDATGRPGLHLDGVAPGARVDVVGAFGSLTLPEPLPDDPLVFIAGGTGITPLRAMMQAARLAGHTQPKPLVYSVRAAEDVAYADEWRAWATEGHGDVF